MKKIICAVLVCVILLGFVGCCFVDGQNDSKKYKYISEGVDGDFEITLFNDGTFRYTEGSNSEYFGIGKWVKEKKYYILTENNRDENNFIFTFRDDDAFIVFMAEYSNEFRTIKLSNEAKFVRVRE